MNKKTITAIAAGAAVAAGTLLGLRPSEQLAPDEFPVNFSRSNHIAVITMSGAQYTGAQTTKNTNGVPWHHFDLTPVYETGTNHLKTVDVVIRDGTNYVYAAGKAFIVIKKQVGAKTQSLDITLKRVAQ